MTLGKRVFAGYAIILAILIVVATASFFSLRNIQTSYEDLIDRRITLVDASEDLRFEAQNQLVNFLGMLLHSNEAEKYLNKLIGGRERFAGAAARMRTLVTSDTGSGMIDTLLLIQSSYEQQQERVILLLQSGRRSEALTLAPQITTPLLEELLSIVDKFRARQLSLQDAGRADVAVLVNSISWLMVFVSILGLAGGIVSGGLLTRSITRQVRESIEQLSSSAAEILAMTTQVAAGASESATAVNETSTTVEEVKQTAEISSQKAKHISESSQKASQLSQAGRKAVEDSIAGMNSINEQMGLIAGSIVRLSEQGQAIGEIIATVNDLAEQSNLLAVNAAIEAARAGEQGKGFSVVAQEVRSLAQQSKQATARVRTILNDIQKATSSAVLATEQGGKAVDSGVKRSTEAGSAIRVLTESVAEAAQAATQINASNQQQLVGMDQVATAMENIKQASMQNVAGTKQAEKAAQNLLVLGNKLKRLVQSSRNGGNGVDQTK